MVYQHATEDRDRVIAEGLAAMAEEAAGLVASRLALEARIGTMPDCR